MKKFLNPLAFTFALAALLFAGGETKAESKLALISAQTVVNCKTTDDPALAHAAIQNNSSTTMTIAVAVEVIVMDPNHHYSICSGGTCYPAKQVNYNPPNPINLAAGAVTEALDYEFKYYPYWFDEEYNPTAPTEGYSKMRITFTDKNNAENVASYEAEFIVKNAGVYELLSGGATVGPNPSRGTVNFNIARPDAIGGELTVYDANGRPVKTIKIESASFSANMADLAGGAYHYAFKAGDKYFGGAFVIER
ncbi:MAG: T9SS type A sorting domain-containing protein [Chloroflexota bacterium]